MIDGDIENGPNESDARADYDEYRATERRPEMSLSKIRFRPSSVKLPGAALVDLVDAESGAFLDRYAYDPEKDSFVGSVREYVADSPGWTIVAIEGETSPDEPSLWSVLVYAPGEHGLTENQQTVYNAVQDSGPDGGITATEAGLLLHAHPDGRPCVWCKGRGREVLEALKRRGLVRRRKTGVYHTPHSRKD